MFEKTDKGYTLLCVNIVFVRGNGKLCGREVGEGAAGS